MDILGRIANSLYSRMLSYKSWYYSRRVNNSGGVLYGNCTVVHPENIWIGSNSYVNGGYICASKNAKIVIGNDCLISFNVHLRTDMHNYINKADLIREQGFTEKDITIGNDVWIGFGAQIMAGVTIADGCVIGAGAVVTKDTEPYGVYVGVPAQLKKYRE